MDKFWIRLDIGQAPAIIEKVNGDVVCGSIVGWDTPTFVDMKAWRFLPKNRAKEFYKTRDEQLLIMIPHHEIEKIDLELKHFGVLN